MIVCVQLANFSIGDWKDIYRSCHYYNQIGSTPLSHCYHMFPWSCVWDVCYIIFCNLLYIQSGKMGNLFLLILCSLWWVQIVGYVLVCRSYSFIFSCDQAAIWLVQSVRLSVRPSVCLSHLFHHVPIIVLSWNFQELLPWSEVMSMQKVKVRGQRSRSQRSTPNLAVSGL